MQVAMGASSLAHSRRLVDARKRVGAQLGDRDVTKGDAALGAVLAVPVLLMMEPPSSATNEMNIWPVKEPRKRASCTAASSGSGR